MQISVKGPRRASSRRAALLSLSAAFAMGLAGCETLAPDTQSKASGEGIVNEGIPVPPIEEGDALFNLGRYLEAAQIYNRIIQVEPENAAARFGLAESLFQLGEADGALSAYRGLEGNSTYNARVNQGEGMIFLGRGDVAPARQRLEAAVAEDPLLWRSWNALGRVYDLTGDYGRAEEAYYRAMEIQPRSALPVNNLGMSRLGQQRYEEAEDLFAQAIQIDPTFGPARSNLRNAVAWQGRYREALFNVPDKNRPDVLNNVGYIAMLRGDLDVAETLFLRAIEESPSYNVQAADNLRYLQSLKDADKPITQQ